MRISSILWAALAFAALTNAQDNADKVATPKIIPVRYVNVNHLRELVAIPNVSVKADDQMRVLVVSGRPDAVAAIEEMVKKLDVPPTADPTGPNFELSGYLVSGTSQGRADEVPPDLNGVVKQLHSLFPYKSYRVMETLVMRASASPQNRSSNASTSGILPGTNSEYVFGYFTATMPSGPSRSIRLGGLFLNVRTPTSERNKDGEPIRREVGIHTDVDLPEGQKVVVGKSNYSGADDALILVLSVKFVE
jgi:hypothetical protein